jgi:RecA/RadA recombinase
MSQRKITRLQLDPKLTTRLLHHSLTTAHDLLACPPLTLMHIADISYSDATALLALVGSKLIQPHTAYEALQQSNTQQQCVPSGVSGSLTHLLTTGGFPVGTISEVCGPPGIGKTQLCLGCCADVLMQHYMKSHDASSDYLSSSVSGSVSGSVSVCGSGKRGGSVVYYDTELKFSSQRLLEILLKRYPQSAQPSVSDPSVTVAVKLLEKLSVRRPMTCQELRDDLLQLEEHLISEGTSLVI